MAILTSYMMQSVLGKKKPITNFRKCSQITDLVISYQYETQVKCKCMMFITLSAKEVHWYNWMMI